MPRGVGSGAGWQNKEDEASTGIKSAVDRDGVEVAEVGDGVAMAMAVDIRCAMTQPTIFSRWEAPVITGISIRYTLDACRTSGVSGGEESARLMVSSRTVS